MKVALCRIELFGGLRVIQGERTISRFRSQKTAALLAFLAYRRHQSHPREGLIEMLWPWASPMAGRHSLCTALSSLRHQLEPPGVPRGAVLLADRSSVGLNRGTVATDVAEFEAALARAEKAPDAITQAPQLEEAVAIYRGALLAGLYEPWITTEQLRQSEGFVWAAVQLAKIVAERGEMGSATMHLRRAIEAEPLREEPYRELIRCFARTGEPHAALRTFEELERVLREELGGKPSAASIDLVREIQQPAASRSADGGTLSTVAPVGRRSHKARLPAGTVTILLIGMEGESAGSPPAARRLRDEFKRHGGLEIETDGSTLVIAYPLAGDALSCAAACQRALAGGNRGAQHAPEVSLVMVVHSADMAAGDRLPAATLHRTRRLLAAAHPGQILCSEAAAGLLRHDLNGGLRLRDLGVYRLRGATASERIFQLDYRDGEDEFPPLNAESGHASHMPLRLTRFFGRRGEIEQLRGILSSDARLVTVIGPPGCGKTRLAIEVAVGLEETFRGAVWFVPLADLREGEILDRALDPLGIRRSPGIPPLEQIGAALGDEPALIVFDNFEHVIEKAGEIRPLLERLPLLRCLITSRRRLGLTGEREFPVPSLPVPDAPASLPDLLGNVSVELFVDRAQAAKPDFQLTSANAEAVAEICRSLEGVPLAIELAAARSQQLGPPQILERIRKGEHLVSRSRDTEDRHRSFQAAVGWSYSLLSPELQRLLARLSVFRGGWSAEAAEKVCDEPLALDYLSELAECSLVLVEQNAVGARFRMLEMVRDYSMSRLEQFGDAAATRRRHRDFFLALVSSRAPTPQNPASAAWFEAMEMEHDNLRAVLDRCAEAEDGGVYSLRLCDQLWHFWEMRHLTEGRRYLEQALSRPDTRVPSPIRAGALGAAGNLALYQGDYPAARLHLEEALAISRSVGDRVALARALHNLGNMLAMQSPPDAAARPLLDEALVLNRDLGHRAWEVRNLAGLGLVALNECSYSEANARFEQELALAEELGDRRMIAGAIGSLGSIARRTGDLVLHPESSVTYFGGLRRRRAWRHELAVSS